MLYSQSNKNFGEHIISCHNNIERYIIMLFFETDDINISLLFNSALF